MLTSAFLTPLHMHAFSVHKLLVDDVEALHSGASASGVQWVSCGQYLFEPVDLGVAVVPYTADVDSLPTTNSHCDTPLWSQPHM